MQKPDFKSVISSIDRNTPAKLLEYAKKKPLKAIPVAAVVVLTPVALSLAGCGESNNAGFNNNGGDEINYEESQLFYVNDTKGTLFDDETSEHFKHLGINNYLVYGTESAEGLEKAKVKIQQIRAALDALPVSDELKSEYEANLVKAEEVLVKKVELHEGKYTGNLEKAFRNVHPEYFVELDKVQAKIDQRNVFLSASQTNLNNIEKELKEKTAELEQLEKKHDKAAAKWVVENEVLIPKSEISFNVITLWNDYSDSKADCDDLWNAEADVCLSYRVNNYNLGIDHDYLKEMTEKQADQYKQMAAQFYENGKPLAFKISTLKKAYRDADSVNDKQILLANNRFGTRSELIRELSDANRALNFKSKGAYRRNGQLDKPSKGYFNPAQEKVLDAYAEQLGLKGMPEATAFTPENAYKVLKSIIEKTKSKAIDLEMDDEGQFYVDENQMPENIYVVKNTGNQNLISEVGLSKREEGFIAFTRSTDQGETLLDVRAIRNKFNPSFALQSDYRDLQDYMQRQM